MEERSTWHWTAPLALRLVVNKLASVDLPSPRGGRSASQRVAGDVRLNRVAGVEMH